MNLPCSQTFTDTILPTVFEKLKLFVEKRLNTAEYVTLIPDIWTNREMKDFMGLVACVMDKDFCKKYFEIWY